MSCQHIWKADGTHGGFLCGGRPGPGDRVKCDRCGSMVPGKQDGTPREHHCVEEVSPQRTSSQPSR